MAIASAAAASGRVKPQVVQTQVLGEPGGVMQGVSEKENTNLGGQVPIGAVQWQPLDGGEEVM